jgi:hypothetical protein
MSTNNPFRKHTSSMFATRGCDIDEAIVYANDVITALPTEAQAGAMTAVMVLVNTAANAFDQARGPSPEKLAIIDLIRNEIDNWASSHLDNHIEGWIDNNLGAHTAIDDKVQEYINDNLDVDEKISEWMNEYLESHISEAIENIDLVVRVR